MSRGGCRARTALAVGLALVGTATGASAQEWQTLERSRRLTDDQPVRVELRYGVGRLTLGPSDDATRLYELRMRYDAEAFDPVTTFDDGTLQLGLEGRGRGLNLRALDDDAEFDVHLGPRVDLDLSIEFGAGEAELELGGLRLSGLTLATGASKARLSIDRPNPVAMNLATLAVGAAEFSATGLANLNARRLEVEAGIGEVTLDFSGTLARDLEVDVSMGLGELQLRLPRSAGIRIERSSSFLASLDVEGMIERDGALYSPNWDDATRRITVSTAAAMGSIEISWLR